MGEDPGAEEIVTRYKPLKTTSISCAEFLYGAKKSWKKKMYDISEKFLHFFPIVPFDAESAFIYADIASSFQEAAGTSLLSMS